MKKSRIQINFPWNRSEEWTIISNMQRNYSVSPLRQCKTGYDEKLGVQEVSDSKVFWKTIIPLL